MIYRGVLKRIIPFFLTFAAGLFIASFFISIAAPNLQNWRSGRGSYKHRELHRLRTENKELRDSNCRMKKELEELRRNSSNWDQTELELAVPPVVPDAPQPPPPSRYTRRGR